MPFLLIIKSVLVINVIIHVFLQIRLHVLLDAQLVPLGVTTFHFELSFGEECPFYFDLLGGSVSEFLENLKRFLHARYMC